MKKTQISIFLENKPGALAGICRTLASAGVNITALSLAEWSDFGIARLIADDHAKGRAALEAAGFAVRETEVVAVEVPDRAGGMAEIMESLDKAGVDIKYSYANVGGLGEKAVLVFRFDDNDRAEKALSGR